MKKSVLLGMLASMAWLSFAEEAEKVIHFNDLTNEEKEAFVCRMKEDKAPLIELEVRFVEANSNDVKFIIYEMTNGTTNGLHIPEHLQHWQDNELVLDLLLHATFSRCGSREDVLSAHKVTARSGHQVIIAVGEDCIFPTTLEVCPTAVTNDMSIAYDMAVVPGGWATQHVGIALSALPTWNPETDRIDLADLTAAVIGEPVWKAYPISVTNNLGQNHPFELPTFFAQIISTNLLSVRSGVTTLLETRTRAVRRKGEDKVFILGDIPLLGRLFRYKYEIPEERTLLVFVTARLIDPLRKEEP